MPGGTFEEVIVLVVAGAHGEDAESRGRAAGAGPLPAASSVPLRPPTAGSFRSSPEHFQAASPCPARLERGGEGSCEGPRLGPVEAGR